MRVLLAVDGSPSSIEARDLVANLMPSATVRVMTAYDPPAEWIGDSDGIRWAGETEVELRKELLTQLDRLAAPLIGRNPTVERRAVGGRPARAIIDQASAFGADLIVLGSRGRGRLRSMLLGSTSAEVVERARCSVLVTRSRGVSRLLVATDGSSSAQHLPDILAALDVFRGLPADVLSVAPPPDRVFELLADMYTLGTHDWLEDPLAMIAKHQRFADELAQRLDSLGIEAISMARTGDPAHEIITAARETGANLIVTGSRALRGLDRLVLGSVARNVVFHAPVSVLVARPVLLRPRGVQQRATPDRTAIPALPA